ncbi:phosphoserine phosphatase SerB [Dongshaea marina]|uniref:phosphoserine phosphatase SerB n=1 Tax=Dongshaea marina TaxID=2047966 RepID=UPI00131F2E33|nr:phosphoserine phosphatase SerB [Dongshaea marina]
MDSTAITIECIDEMAHLAGVGDAVSAITARAMRGELDFEQSLRARLMKLKGMQRQQLEALAHSLPLMPGLEELVGCVRRSGWQVHIASGGFTLFAEALQKQLDLDGVCANRLAFCGDELSGEVEGRVVDASVKQQQLRMLAGQLGVTGRQIVAIGDGANDLKMLAAAGVGIALHAKPKVQQAAQCVVNHGNLEVVRGLLGASSRLNWFWS